MRGMLRSLAALLILSVMPATSAGAMELVETASLEEKVAQGELPLAVSAAEPDPLREAIDAIDPDSMTPRDALDAIYRLKDL